MAESKEPRLTELPRFVVGESVELRDVHFEIQAVYAETLVLVRRSMASTDVESVAEAVRNFKSLYD